MAPEDPLRALRERQKVSLWKDMPPIRTPNNLVTLDRQNLVTFQRHAPHNLVTLERHAPY